MNGVQNRHIVTHTRAHYYNRWIIRELALAILTAALMGGSIWALKDIHSFTQFTHLTPWPVWAYKTILVISAIFGLRTLLCRPLAALAIRSYVMPKVIYPIGQYMNNWFHKPCELHASWVDNDRVKHLTWKAYDDRTIHGCLIEGTNSNDIIILSLGNGVIYKELNLRAFKKLLNEGYSLIFYDPPAYGETEGPRTALSDFYALEAIVQSIKERRIHLWGQSIGSGPCSAIAAKYPIHTLRLLMPFCTLEGVMKHKAPLPKVAGLIFSSVIQDLVYYDNGSYVAEAIRNKNVKQIEIYATEDDPLMTLGNETAEAEKIFQKARKELGHKAEYMIDHGMLSCENDPAYECHRIDNNDITMFYRKVEAGLEHRLPLIFNDMPIIKV